MKFLKEEHGVIHGFANTIVTLLKEKNNSPDDLIANQYRGKEELLPIYNKIIALVSSFGDDMTITPKKGSVSIIRKKQFALIKPTTKTRIDLGLKIVGKYLTTRLENSGLFGTICSQRA